jgi:hypothetical protein
LVNVRCRALRKQKDRSAKSAVTKSAVTRSRRRRTRSKNSNSNFFDKVHSQAFRISNALGAMMRYASSATNSS